MTCVSFPGREGVPAVAQKTITSYDLAWDAGADSVQTLDGNCHLVFTMPNPVVAAVVGIKGTPNGVGIPELVDFGFYFQIGPGANFYNVIENGVAMTAPVTRDSMLDETFEVRRELGKVTYLVNDVVIYTSKQRSTGWVIAPGCLFATGDSIA